MIDLELADVDPTPEELAAALESFGHSQERAAAIIGVSRNTVQNWLAGRSQPTGAGRMNLIRYIAKSKASEASS